MQISDDSDPQSGHRTWSGAQANKQNALRRPQTVWRSCAEEEGIGAVCVRAYVEQ